MREFIRESWKTASAVAAGAFLLSILIGLITSNPFGIVLMRAFLLAIFFAGLGAGLRWAVRTWLADPTAGAAAGAAGPAESGRGSRVDITLGEETTPGRDDAHGAGAGAGEDSPGDVAGDLASPAADDAAAQAEAAALGELTQELGEDSAEEEASGVEEMDGEPPPDLPTARSRRGARGSGDSLPDITVDDEPPPRPVSRPRRSRPETPSEAMRDAVRDTVARQDPATLARALRTVLKKDEKG